MGTAWSSAIGAASPYSSRTGVECGRRPDDATFVLGPGIVVGVGNGLILGYLMYTSGPVPRRMAMFGLVGGPLLFASGIAVMFGAFDINSAPRFVCSLPEIIWKASIGIYLTFKGFKVSSPVVDESRDTGVDPGLAIAAP